MTPPDLLQAVGAVVMAFTDLGISYFIGGSVASSAYGVARSTLDVDLVADLRDHHVDPLVTRLNDAYYIDAGMIRRALAQRSSFNLIHLDTMMKVDVFILKETPYDQIAFQRRRPDTLDEDPAAPPINLAAPEDVILHKLWWFRLGGEVSERQWGDALGVLEVQAVTLDFGYLRHWASRLELDDLLHDALEKAHIPCPDL